MQSFNEWDSAGLLKVNLEADVKDALNPTPTPTVGAPDPVQQGGDDIDATPAITASGADPPSLRGRDIEAERRESNFNALTGGDKGQMAGGWAGEAARSLLNPLHLGQRAIQGLGGPTPKGQWQALGTGAKAVAGAVPGVPGAVKDVGRGLMTGLGDVGRGLAAGATQSVGQNLSDINQWTQQTDLSPGSMRMRGQDYVDEKGQGPDWAQGKGTGWRARASKGAMNLLQQGAEGGRKKQEMPGWMQALRHPFSRPDLEEDDSPLLDPNTAAGQAALRQQKTQRHDVAMRDALAGMDMDELKIANPDMYRQLTEGGMIEQPMGTTAAQGESSLLESGKVIGGQAPKWKPSNLAAAMSLAGDVGKVAAVPIAAAVGGPLAGLGAAAVGLATSTNVRDRFAAWRNRRAEGAGPLEALRTGATATEMPRDPRTNLPEGAVPNWRGGTPEARIAERQASAAVVGQQARQSAAGFAHDRQYAPKFDEGNRYQQIASAQAAATGHARFGYADRATAAATRATGTVPGESQYVGYSPAPTRQQLSGPATFGTQGAAEIPEEAAFVPSNVAGTQATPGGTVTPQIDRSTAEAAAQRREPIATHPAGREAQQLEHPDTLLRSEPIVTPMTGAWFQDRFGKTANDITKELRLHRRYKKAIKGEIDIAIGSVRLLKRMEVEDTLEAMPWLDSSILQTLGFSERDLKSLRTAAYNQDALKNHLIRFGEAKATEEAMLKAFFEQGDWHGNQQEDYAKSIQQQKLTRTGFRTTLHKEDRLTPNEVRTLERCRGILLKQNKYFTANEIHANMEQKEKRNLSVQSLSALLRSYGGTQGIDVSKETRKSMFIVRQSDMLIKDLYAYVSGFIDGDGYITISKRFEPRIGLIATGSRGREYCIGIQKSLGYGRLMLDQKTQSDTQRSQHRLLFYSKDDIKKLLTKCKPHLRMKGGQADAVLELLKLRDFKRQDLVKERKKQLFAICKYENWSDARNADSEFAKYGIDIEDVKKWKADGPLTLDVLEAKELVEKVIA